MRYLLYILLLPLTLVLYSCQYAPPLGYAESAPLVQKRVSLCNKLLQMLPPEQQTDSAAQQEARWLADTAYKASAAIARQYDPCLPGWLNNRLVNSRLNLQERGLCWHYAHDMYRELRRRPLSYFFLGFCVRDQGESSEHNCIFIAPQDVLWPQVLILDAWRYNGRLKLIEEDEVLKDAWEPNGGTTLALSRIYTENHLYPMEHWVQVKSGRKWNEYVPSWSPEGTSSRQGMLMQQNIHHGLLKRGGKLTDY